MPRLAEKLTPNDVRARMRALPAGAVVAIGGLSLSRRPVELCKLLQMSGAKELTLAGITLSIESEALIAAGLVRAVRTSYFGLDLFGLAPAFTAAAEAGRLQVIDESERSFCAAIPSMKIELALIHMPFADAAGNAYGYGSPGVDADLARAAKRVIVSIEEPQEGEASPARWTLPAADVDAIVRIPGGARPTSCAPLYAFDGAALVAHAGKTA